MSTSSRRRTLLLVVLVVLLGYVKFDPANTPSSPEAQHAGQQQSPSVKLGFQPAPDAALPSVRAKPVSTVQPTSPFTRPPATDATTIIRVPRRPQYTTRLPTPSPQPSHHPTPNTDASDEDDQQHVATPRPQRHRPSSPPKSRLNLQADADPLPPPFEPYEKTPRCRRVYKHQSTMDTIQRGSWEAVDVSAAQQIQQRLRAAAKDQLEQPTFSSRTEELLNDNALKVMVQLSKNLEGGRTICVVGFGTGSSSAVLLHSNPAVKLIVFDPIERTNSSKQAMTHVSGELGADVEDRVEFYTGKLQYTTKQVYSFAAERPHTKCSLMFVDGSLSTLSVGSSPNLSGGSSDPEAVSELFLNLRDLRSLADPDNHVLVVHGVEDGEEGVGRWLSKHHQQQTFTPVFELPSPPTTTGNTVLLGLLQYNLGIPSCPDLSLESQAGRAAVKKAIFDGSWDHVDVTRVNNAIKAAETGRKQALQNEPGGQRDSYLKSLPTQKKIYAAVANHLNDLQSSSPSRTICDVSSNYGETASIWLRTTPADDSVILFDTNQQSASIAKKIAVRAGSADDSRFTTVKSNGKSLHSMLGTFARQHPSKKCDVVNIAGRLGTSDDGTNTLFKILKRLQSLANPTHHVVIMDNTNCEAPADGSSCWNEELLVEAERHKMIVTQLHLAEKALRHGVTLFQFSLGGGSGGATTCLRQHPESSPHAAWQELRAIQRGSWKDVRLEEHDRVAEALKKAVRARDAEGHSGQLVVERQLYISLASMSNVRTICEIGFNAGHSAALWLQANPNATVLMFDLWHRKVSEQGEKFFANGAAEKAGIVRPRERLSIIKGDSRHTVPKYFEEHPSTSCDLISVDGAHSIEMATKDMQFMKNYANKDFHVAVIDDTSCDSGWCVDAAVTEMQKRGQIRTVMHFSEASFTRGVSAFQYRFHSQPSCEVEHEDQRLASKVAAAKKELSDIFQEGQWQHVDLKPFNDLAKRMDKHCDLNCDGEGGSIGLTYERQIYVRLAQMKNVKRICEIGFNRGHSAALWLKANPNAEVIMFDLWKWRAANKGLQFIRLGESFNNISNNPKERLQVYKGFSAKTVRKFVTDNPNTKCDLLIIDGGHEYIVAEKDITNMKMLANPDFHVGIIDDSNCWAGYCVDSAVREHGERQQIKILYALGEGTHAKDKGQMDRGVTVFQYDLGLPMP